MLSFLMRQGSNIISSFVKSPKAVALKESEYILPLNIIICEYANLYSEVYVVQHYLVNHHNVSTTSEPAMMQHTFQLARARINSKSDHQQFSHRCWRPDICWDWTPKALCCPRTLCNKGGQEDEAGQEGQE